jgi:hypothetical protein
MKKVLLFPAALFFTQWINAQKPTVIIQLNGASSMMQPVNQSFADPGVTARDSAQNDYSAIVNVTGIINTSVLGAYQLIYSISPDTVNAIPVTRTVIVVDNSPPVIQPLGPLSIWGISGRFVDPGVKLIDNYYDDATLQGLVTITSTPNVKVEGWTYTLQDGNTGYVYYHLTDPSGNTANSVMRILLPPLEGLTELNSNLLALYPNPASNQLTFESTHDIDRCFLMDVSGKTYPLLPEKKSTGYTVDISLFDEGLYLFFIESDHQRYYSKLMISKGQ